MLGKTLTIMIALVLLSMAGCADNPDGTPHYMEKKCYDGVVYYFSLKRLAPAFNPDSTVKTCES